MRIKADIVIVGSGCAGAAIAKELAQKGKNVILIERGFFYPRVGTHRDGLKFYDRCGLNTSKEGIIIYRTLMVGGTTVASCGNGVITLEKELRALGVDLREEFQEVLSELAVGPLAPRLVGKGTQLIVEAARKVGVHMEPMPKYIDSRKCISCGLCVLGCRTGAKWTSNTHIKEMQRYGGRIITGIEILSVVTHHGRAIGLVGKMQNQRVRINADTVVLSAGGLGSPRILRKSGIIQAGNRFFVDLFHVTYGILNQRNVQLCREPTMSVVSTQFRDDGFILSPYVDVPLIYRWLLPKRRQINAHSIKDVLGIMTKIKDDSTGYLPDTGLFSKFPSSNDVVKLRKGADLAEKIFMQLGIKKRNIFTTRVRGAHPGGTAGIGYVVDRNLRTPVQNLYVCDASVLPESPGAPPVITILALAKRLSKTIAHA